jgi:hypothetical protein
MSLGQIRGEGQGCKAAIAVEFRKVLEKQAVQSEKAVKQATVLLFYRLIRILQHGQSGCFIVSH